MRTVLLAAAACVLLGGCSSQEPAAGPAPLPPASPSGSPSYSPPPLPEPQASAGVDREVEEAVLAYFRGINRLLATGEPAEFDASYTAACSECAAFSRKVVDIYGKGQRIEGARDEVQRLVVAGGNSAQAGAATVTFRVPAYRIVASDGAEVGSYPESSATRIFTVAKGRGGFQVVAIQDAAA